MQYICPKRKFKKDDLIMEWSGYSAQIEEALDLVAFAITFATALFSVIMISFHTYGRVDAAECKFTHGAIWCKHTIHSEQGTCDLFERPPAYTINSTISINIHDNFLCTSGEHRFYMGRVFAYIALISASCSTLYIFGTWLRVRFTEPTVVRTSYKTHIV